MYLALRDLRFAKGRFILMGGVVALITLLLVLLSGLTAGLGNQSTSALAALPADQIVFGAPAGDSAKASFTESEVTRGQLSEWAARDGVAQAELLGISQSRFQAVGPAGTPSGTASVAVFGDRGAGAAGLAPGPVAEGTVLIGASLAEELDLHAGSLATVGGTELTVSAVVPDQWYSHTGVVWTTLGDWRKLAHITGTDAAATVIAVTSDDGRHARRRRRQRSRRDGQHHPGRVLPGPRLLQERKRFPAAHAGVPVRDLGPGHRGLPDGVDRAAHPGHRRPQGPRRFLRLRPQGRHGAGGGRAPRRGRGRRRGRRGRRRPRRRAVPFLLTPQTTLLPIAGIVVLGLAGAALAVRSITRVDPLLALGGN